VRRATSLRTGLAVLGLLGAAACQNENPLGLPVPDRILVTSPAASLFVGEAVQLQAIGVNSAGDELPAFEPNWTSSDGNIASVSTTGLLIGVAPGTATIRASLSGKTGSVTVTVEPQPVQLDTVDVGPGTATPGTVTIRNGGAVRFRFGATAGDVTFRAMQNGAPTNITASTNTMVERRFFTVGDFVWDNSASPGTTGTVRVR
jgi:hypothetical protein